MSLTIGKTISQLRTALRDYIEAYHISHPMLSAQRQCVLDQFGVIHQRPYLENTPRYQSGARCAKLGLGDSTLELFTALSQSRGNLEVVVHDPPCQHQAQAVQLSLRGHKSLVVITGTGSGKYRALSPADWNARVAGDLGRVALRRADALDHRVA